VTSSLRLKLQTYSKLSEADRVALDRVSRTSVHEVAPRRDVIREGDKPSHVRLVLAGWACRYKTTPDGRRQIVGLFVPGDFCDLNVYVLSQMDHSIAAITRVTLAAIIPEQMEELTSDHPRITQALWWHELVNASIQREWLLNLGQRGAFERIGHLMVELFFRLRIVGMTDRDSCEFPLTQNDLADATGLTAVHVNRTLQELRREGLIELDRRRLRFPDLERLMQASQFNPKYLHLDRTGRHLDAND
jgi:CRP-like cAMP-binding protein